VDVKETGHLSFTYILSMIYFQEWEQQVLSRCL